MALSAVSTCNSGFMFIGMIGFTYVYGFSAIWLIVSWILGDVCAWCLVHRPLREKSALLSTSTLSGFISEHLNSSVVAKLSALFIFIFLSVYAAAQLTAGSKALYVLLGWPHTWGVLIGAIIVTIYSISGGIRASIWTDVVQSILMIVSMVGLLIVAFYTIGGISELGRQLYLIDPQLVSWFPIKTEWGFPLYFAGWLAFGFGVIGQPHIMVRPMIIKESSDLKKARIIYFTWYTLFNLGALGVGLTARVLLPELQTLDTELALPVLATRLLPEICVGGILAGIFSATISTADSQILTCSAAISQDLLPKWKSKLSMSKVATLLTVGIVVFISLFGSKNVFILVVFAWSSLAVTLGPLIILKCLNIHVGTRTSLTMMVCSFATVLLWTQVFKLSNSVNEVLPGFVISFLCFGISGIVKKR
jgi:sodium/proline symporter